MENIKEWETWETECMNSIKRFTSIHSREYRLDHHEQDDITGNVLLYITNKMYIYYLYAWDVHPAVKHGYLRSITRSRIEDYIRKEKAYRGNAGMPARFSVMCKAGNVETWIRSNRSMGMILIAESNPEHVPDIGKVKKTLPALLWDSACYTDSDLLGNIIESEDGCSIPESERLAFNEYLKSHSDKHLKRLFRAAQAIADRNAAWADYKIVSRARKTIKSM
jgi:hypothetical protein